MSLLKARASVAPPLRSVTALVGAAILLAACGEAPATALDGATAVEVAPSLRKGPGGNSLNAKACQKNGWQELVTSTGTAFASEEACVAYAAQGGMLFWGQTITFGPLADQTFGGADFTVSASASSGLPVAFAASGQCTVAGSTVSLTGAGSCTISASQSGDATTAAAVSVDQSFAIAKGNQSITFGALADKTFGDAAFAVDATASSGLPVSFGATGDCTVTGTSVSVTGAGSCIITASQGGDANWNAAADVPQAFAIAKASQSVSFTSPNPSPAAVGTTYAPTATATSGLPVAITLDAASTGCALAGGVVSFTAAGTCVVNANEPGNSNYNAAAQVQQSISVIVPCISDDASLRAAAAAGGSHTFCAAGTRVVLTGGQITVGTTLVLSAVGAGNAIIDADAKSRVIEVIPGGHLTLNNVTVTNGREAVNGRGGGVRVNQGALILNGSSAVSGNTAAVGAGLYIGFGSAVTLNNLSTVVNNTAQPLAGFDGSGGGVHHESGAVLTMNGASTITGNRALGSFPRGGGVLNNAGTIIMNGTSGITNNGSSAVVNGGGLYFVNGGSFTMSATARITGNVAQNGGGIYRIDGGIGSFEGVTATNVTGNVPNNCASASPAPAVPGCVNP